MAGIAKVAVDARAGDLLLTLRAEKALPIQGVLSSRESGDVHIEETGDPSIVAWVLPPEPALYVVYGAIIPARNLMFAPSYVRSLKQGGINLLDPRRFKTEKHDDGEWLGPPEAIKIIF